MSIAKKTLSVFLSALMVLSSITVGLTVFAANNIKTYNGLDENYQALASALQKSYVVDANNYKKAANRAFEADDNENGDIGAAADAFFSIIDSSEKKRYGTAVKDVETTLKSAMGKDFTSAMSKAIGYICGNGSISAYTSSVAYKFTVNQNINLILDEYSSASDVPDMAQEKAVVYIYSQTGTSSNYSTVTEKGAADVSTAVFRSFANMFSAETLSSDYDALPDGALENIEENGQEIIDAASIISAENIKRLIGENVSIESAQAYLDGILLFKAREYTKAVDAIKTELDGKKIEDFDFDALKILKEKLDAADKLYSSYVDVQKESVENSHNDYNALVKFYEESFNYNKAPEYAQAVKAVEKYADDAYEFTREELPDVKKLLDAVQEKYKEFLGTPSYQGILDSKAVYDKALENYTKAYEFYDWQDYYAVLKEFSVCFENETVLSIPKTAYLDGSKMTLPDDVDQSILNAQRKFVYLIDFLFTKHKDDYPKIENAAEKITADLAEIMGSDAVKDKDIYNILLNYFNNGTVSSGSYTKTIVVKRAYLFEYNSVNDIPESIAYKNNQFVISYNKTTNAYTSYKESTPNATDTVAYGAFSLFNLTFTDDFLNRNLNECNFNELSLIKRKSVAALDGISSYTQRDIAHFFGDKKYTQAQALNSKCDELMKTLFNALIDSIVDKYGNREVDFSEVKSFFTEADLIDNAYKQLSNAVKTSADVTENMEKYNTLKLYVKGIADEVNADEFVDMVKAFTDKYPKKSLDMSIYGAFNSDLKTVLDFYSSCSEETMTMQRVVKASEDLTKLSEAMDAVFRAYRFEQFKQEAKNKLEPLYTGELENAQIIEFTTFDIADIKQTISDINAIYGDLSEDAMTDELVVNYMAVVSKLSDRIVRLTNPPEFKPYTVEYPEGVTSAEVSDIILRLDELMASDVIEALAGKPLDAAVDDALNGLLTADIVNTLVKALYPMVADALGSNASVAGILKINVIPRTLATNIVHYPSVKAALEAAGDDWNAVDWELCDWVTAKGVAVTNVDTFIDALGEALSGVNKILNVLLNGVTLNALVITLHGNQGYEKDILPLLELLGCDEENGLVTGEVFNSASNDVPQMLKYIIYPLIDRVKQILRENTVSEVLSLLPNLAYILNNDILNAGFADLVSPLKEQIDLVKTLNNAGIDLTNIIATVNKLLGNKGIALPVLNWAELAGIGSYKQMPSLRLGSVRNYIEANNADVLVYVLYYAIGVIHNNDKMIGDLIGSKIDNDIIVNLLNTVLSNDDKTVVKSLVTMLTAYDVPDYNWPQFKFTKTNVKYPDTFNSKDMDMLVDSLSGILANVLTLALDGSLNDIISNKLYTGEIVSQLFNALYISLDNEQLVQILSNVEIKDADGKVSVIDLSKDAVYKNLKSAGFKSAAKVVKNADSLKAAITSPDDWKIENAEDFVDALCAIFAPFNGVITALLAGDGYEVSALDVVELYGANGYNNAVKPILDSIGCECMTVSEYNKQAQKNSANALKNILLPLINFVSKIANDPLKSVIDIVPSASLFISNGGLQTAVRQLLAPLNNVLGGIAMLVKTNDAYEWLINDLVSSLTGIKLDWNNLQNQIIPLLNDKVLGNIKINDKTSLSLSIPNINWSHFAGCMNKSANGYKTVTADCATEAVRYIWKAVQNNKTEIEKLVKSLVSEDTYKTVSTIVSNLLKLNADEIIKMAIDLLNGLDSSSFRADWSFLYKNYNETAVKLPNGVTSSELEEVVSILSDAVNNALGTFLDRPLTSLVGDNLYKDSVITSLAAAIYSLSENDTVVTVLGLLGCDLSKDSIARSLKSDYKSVSKSIDKADTLSAADTSNWQWNVTDRASFAKALVAVLRPLTPVLEVLLNSGSINIADVIDFKGANGYENAVKPLLDALGCSTVSQSAYAGDAKNNSDKLLLNIINPLLDQVDVILANPVEMAAELAPQIANFIDKGGVQYAVESLLYPVTNLINPILSVITNETIFDFLFDILNVNISWDNLQYQIVPLLNDAVLSDLKINGKTLSLLLPPIDWGTLAGCGSVKGNSIKADTGKELITLLRYVFSVLNKNESTLMSLVGGKDSTAGKIIANVLNCGADKLTQIVVNILLKMDTFDNVGWVFKDILKQTTRYTANFGEEEYSQALEQIDPLINGLISELAGKSLTELATGALYTNNIVNTLAKLIYTNLESLDIGIDLNTVLSLVDVDISTYGVANAVSDYKSASNQIAKCAKWSNVNFDKLNWGFSDGDRDGFVNALAAVLRPLHGVLRAVLSGEDLVVLGSVEIKGGNGYNTAIIPIAEALGIDSKTLVSPSQYAKDANSDKVLTDILNPLLDKVEDILESPVNSLADMLPNLAYFVYNGGVKAAVDNLIAPVTRILDEIDPIYSVNLDLSMLDNLDIDSLVNSLIKDIKIKDKPLGIQITNINLETLAGRGTLTNYQSARTYYGKQMQAKRIDADSTAVFISVLRYLVENIKFNLDAINNLLAGLDIPDNIAGIINQILTALTTEDVDSVIEMLMDLLFGFGGGEALQVTSEEEHFDPFNLGNYYWVYWVIFAVVTAATGFFLFLILKKKKEREDDLSVNEIKGENV